MNKQVYTELLKGSILQEIGIPKEVTSMGPMLTNILHYKGEGELQTHTDASDILERYYFKENNEESTVDILDEAPENVIPEEPEENINDAIKDINDEIEPEKTDGDSKSVLVKADAVKESDETIIEDDIENTVLEKLMLELEQSEDEKEEEEKEEEDKETGNDENDVEKIDVDKELKESLPGFKTSTGYKIGTGGSFTGDELEEAFQLFQEQVEEQEQE